MHASLNEPEFIVFGHNYADKGHAIPFKAISQGK